MTYLDSVERGCDEQVFVNALFATAVNIRAHVGQQSGKCVAVLISASKAGATVGGCDFLQFRSA